MNMATTTKQKKLQDAAKLLKMWTDLGRRFERAARRAEKAAAPKKRVRK
jgi:hypothetical protein